MVVVESEFWNNKSIRWFFFFCFFVLFSKQGKEKICGGLID